MPACADGVACGEPHVCCERRLLNSHLVLDERHLLHYFGCLVGRQGAFRQRVYRRAHREWQLFSDLYRLGRQRKRVGDGDGVTRSTHHALSGPKPHVWCSAVSGVL